MFDFNSYRTSTSRRQILFLKWAWVARGGGSSNRNEPMHLEGSWPSSDVILNILKINNESGRRACGESGGQWAQGRLSWEQIFLTGASRTSCILAGQIQTLLRITQDLWGRVQISVLAFKYPQTPQCLLSLLISATSQGVIPRSPGSRSPLVPELVVVSLREKGDQRIQNKEICKT